MVDIAMFAGRRIAAIAIVAAPFVLLAPAQGCAAEATPAPESGTELHLTETVQHQVERDRLRAVLQIQVEGPDPAKIQAEVNRRMTAIVKAAKSVPLIKAETGNYVVYREAPTAPDKQEPEKWLASQSLIVTSKEFADALGVIGQMQAKGMTLEGLGFDVSPETLRATQDSLTAEALAALRARAERIAGAMNMAVSRYKLLQVGNATEQGGIAPMPMGMMAAKAGPAAPPPVAEAGESAVWLTVDAQIVLRPKAAP